MHGWKTKWIIKLRPTLMKQRCGTMQAGNGREHKHPVQSDIVQNILLISINRLRVWAGNSQRTLKMVDIQWQRDGEEKAEEDKEKETYITRGLRTWSECGMTGRQEGKLECWLHQTTSTKITNKEWWRRCERKRLKKKATDHEIICHQEHNQDSMEN